MGVKKGMQPLLHTMRVVMRNGASFNIQTTMRRSTPYMLQAVSRGGGSRHGQRVGPLSSGQSVASVGQCATFRCSMGERLHVEVGARLCCRKNTAYRGRGAGAPRTHHAPTAPGAFMTGSALCVMQDTTNNPVYTGEAAGLSLEDQRMQVRLTAVLAAAGRRWSSLDAALACCVGQRM